MQVNELKISAMKNLNLVLTFMVVLLLQSCQKCDPSNESTGLIIDNAIVRVVGGEGGANFITSAADYNAPIEVSFDEGITYEPVDFSEYSVFSLPTTASCSSGYARNVSRNDQAEVVTYTINITECDDCEGTTTIQNWVLTSKVPANYTPIFEVD